MGRRGRAAGRGSAVIQREVHKALNASFAASVARANTGAQPRRFALADAINSATGAGVADWMPRDPRDDVDFGPSNPLLPARLDPVRPDTGRPEPRLSEYPVAWNLPGSESQPMPWATLRSAADAVDIIRRCIEVRKEQLAGMDWAFTLDDQVVQGMYAASDGSQGRSDIEADMHRKLLPEIERLTARWREPWAANGVTFEQWVAAVMEDHLVIDGVAVYPRVTYGGDVTGFELIDPTTIKLLIDHRGSRPSAPYPAFQQILYGFPRAEFSACAREVVGEDGKVYEEIEPGMTADQLYYFRENFRTFTPYGYSAVAQSLISARLYLKRQGWMLAEYDDGSTPLTWLVPDGRDGNLTEKLTFNTRRQWEDSINAELTGQTRARHRIKVGMPGYQPIQMTSADERYKPEYDQHLITMLAGHFGVTSTGLGFSESRGFGNSGLHEGQEAVQDKASTKPDTRMIERLINDLSRKFLKMPAELRFKFVQAEAEDGEAEDGAADAQRARGTITLNDDRKRLGKSPFDFPEADMPLVKMGDAWMPIEGMAKRAEQQAEAEQALVDDQLATSAAQRDMDAAAAAGGDEEDVEKSLELVALTRWRKRGGGARRAFVCKALAPGDFVGGVPRDVEFARWEWVPDGLPDEATDEMIIKFIGADITKAFGRGNDNWRTLARDSRGRWVSRGSMRVDALGPSAPDKPVLAGLKRDAERRRTVMARPATNPDVARKIAGSGIMISGRLKGMPTAAKQNPPSSAHGIKVGSIGPDGTVTDDKGRAVGALHPNVTAEQAEAGGWLYVDTNVPGASGGFRSISVWKEPTAAQNARGAVSGQLPANDASSTMGGMTNSTPTRGERGPDEGQRMAAETRRANADMTDEELSASRRRFGRRDGKAALAAKLSRPAALRLSDMAQSGTAYVGSGKLAGEHAEIERAGFGTRNGSYLDITEAGRAAAGPQPEATRPDFTATSREMSALARKDGDALRQAREANAARSLAAPSADNARAAYAELTAANGGNPVALAELRAKLGGTREQQDAVLRGLAGSPDVAFFPEENQKVRTAADDAAALHIGGENKDLISIDAPRGDDRVNIGDPASVQRWLDETGDYLAAAQAAREANSHVDAQGRRWIEGADGLWRDGNGRAVPGALLPAKAEPQRSVPDTVRESSEAARAEAVAASTPDAPAAPAAPRPIPRREPGQVKRGDIMVVERTDSPTESMRREGHTERKTYEIFRVTSATRDGQAAKVSRLDWHGLDDAGRPVKNVFLRSHGKRNVIPGDQIDVAALRESLLARHYDGHPGQAKPHDDLRELTGVLRSHLRDAPATKTPAKRAEAVAAATPDAPAAPAAPKLSKRQRDMAARFDQLAGEHATDLDVARWRQRALDLTGEMEQVGSGVLAQREADDIRSQMASVQDEFTHAMAGARAAAAARSDGKDERGQAIARTRATLDSRARKVTDRITHLERQIKDYTGETRKKLRGQLNDAKAERQRYLDKIESAERDHDTKLVYDESGKLIGTSYEPPPAQRAPSAQSVNDAMAAQMAAQLANPTQFGARHGKVGPGGLRKGMRVQFRGTSWEVLEEPRKARPDSQGRTGVVFRARREDQGIESTMRLNDGTSIELAAPR